MITVVVDTTTTFVDVMLARTRWIQLLTLCAQEDVTVIVPEVVLRETARHWEEGVVKTLEDARSSWGKANRSLDKLRGFGVDAGVALLPGFPEVIVDQSTFIEAMKERLEAVRVQIRRVPDVDVLDLLDRDLTRRKPFDSEGRGMRDTLVWETLKEVLAEASKQEVVFFVSNNTQDFCDDEGQLDPLLAAETTGDGSLRHIRTLDDLLETAEFDPLLAGLAKSDEDLARFLSAFADFADYTAPSVGEVVRNSLISAAEALVDEDVRTENETTSGLNFTGLEIPSEIEGTQISWVDVHEDTADWQTYETYEGGTLLVRAEIIADISIQGFVYKADYYHLEDVVELVDWDWNDHMAQVVVHINARLIFQMRVDPGADLVDDYEFEDIESLDLTDDDHPWGRG